MIQHTHFNYCPSCASPSIEVFKENGIRCGSCGYVIFHNMAAAVAGIVEVGGKIVLIRRGREPRKGLYVLPGGFVDYRESLEKALVRELKEEISVEVTDIRYFGSFPNIYEYEGVCYFTSDAYFLCKPVTMETLKLSEENTDVLLADPAAIDLETIAFEPMKLMIERFGKRGAYTQG
jgi:ADP-ribose pyrophosphatase YjhB (NUDIX family)